MRKLACVWLLMFLSGCAPFQMDMSAGSVVFSGPNDWFNSQNQYYEYYALRQKDGRLSVTLINTTLYVSVKCNVYWSATPLYVEPSEKMVFKNVPELENKKDMKIFCKRYHTAQPSR